MGDEDAAVGDDGLILVSHRGPVQFSRGDDGQRAAERGGGGLVTAMSSLAGRLGGARWVCAALTDEDTAVTAEHDGASFDLNEHLDADDADADGGLRLRMVAVDPDAHEGFYGIIANPLLWFVQHELWDRPDAPDLTRREHDAFEHGYAAVNRHFAEVVAEEVEEVEAGGGQATVMVHDYHFYLLPALVRERCPEAFLHHFVHIPWPQPDAWRILPPSMRESVFRGLLGNDVVAFHTERFARNFLLGCQELLGLDIDLDDRSVVVDGRSVAARAYPVSIDPEEFGERATSEEVGEHERALWAQRRDHLLLRVDRTDPSKNIVRGFRAFDLMLRDHPELTERVTFLALLQPSRQDVEEYADYTEAIRRVVADVNLDHGTADWQPIDLRLEENLDQAVAAYLLFDVLVVNAIVDGMNLVAKEAMVVNRRDGVLALSETTGAYEELGGFAVTLYPFDVAQQADALYRALTMGADERRHRSRAAAGWVREHDVAAWLGAQLSDIAELRGKP
ncbi:MAG: trehalose-6-phosphate synthase [Actinomycetota bacterium]|jgi:trehalose 6-phosphate synthase|nr:trehalose-6-phosphate synthase [Actinomycetota bacterium]